MTIARDKTSGEVVGQVVNIDKPSAERGYWILHKHVYKHVPRSSVRLEELR